MSSSLKNLLLAAKDYIFPKDDEGSGTPDLIRFPQFDWWSCGAKSTYMVMRHFGRRHSYERVKRDLGTNSEGTYETCVVRVLRESGLSAGKHRRMKLADLDRLLKRGGVLIA